MMQPFVSALGTDLGLTSKEIADIIWLALQMQDSDESAAMNEQLEAAQDFSDRSHYSPGDFSDLDDEDDEDSDSQTQSAELHLNQPNGNQAGFGQQLALNVPDARSLREPLSLARSLKPLLRRVVTGWSTVLDEAATVERIADEQLWLPVLKPALEPWLDLALVVDESDSMQIWQRTIAELQRLLSHYGVFRDVRVWGLVTEAGGEVRLRPGLGAAGRLRATRRPSELIDPSGRRLILVATDCVATGWQDGRLLPTLKLWATSGPLAIVQMLPEWLWSRTGLGFAAAVRLQGLLPGVPNQQLVATDGALWDEVDLNAGVKVPVVTLEPEPFGAWTAMVAGKGEAWTPGFVFEPETVAPDNPIAELPNSFAEGSAKQRVQRFRVTASPMARRLAGLLAAAPVISLPVVRIIQDRLLPEAWQIHVAEVFLGGLLQPLEEIGTGTNPDVVQYDFLDGVREVLLEAVPTSNSVNVLEEVSKFVAERLGLSLDAFVAILRRPGQEKNQELVNQSRPFAMVTAQILRQLGGAYVRLAKELEQSHQLDLQLDSTFREMPIEYKVGGHLSLNDPSYVVRQADHDLYESLKAGEFCSVLSSRQVGKSSLRVRTMHRLQTEGVVGVAIDLTKIGSQEITPDQWYAGLMRRLVNSLRLPIDLRTWLQEREFLPPVQRFNELIEKVLLKTVTSPIVIFIDEIDSILSFNFPMDDFFASIQSCQEYDRLTFALLGVAHPADLIQNKQRTPFNIGRAIELNGFQLSEVAPLAKGLAPKVSNPQAVLEAVLAWTEGQPFLTQKICHLIATSEEQIVAGQERASVKKLVRSRLIDHWESMDDPPHLKTIRDRMLRLGQRSRSLLDMYQKVLVNSTVEASNNSNEMALRLSGVVVKRGGKLHIANRIYAAVFNQNWVNKAFTDLNVDDFLQIVETQERKLLSMLNVMEGKDFAEILYQILGPITLSFRKLMRCDRSTIFFIDEIKNDIWSIIVHHDKFNEIQVIGNKGSQEILTNFRRIVSTPVSLPSEILTLDTEEDSYHVYNELVFPITSESQDKSQNLVAMIQLVNKLNPISLSTDPLADRINSKGFTTADERQLEEYSPAILRVLARCQDCYKLTQRVQESGIISENDSSDSATPHSLQSPL